MTTLAQDAQRPFELGTINELPVIAGDIIYEGAAVGIVAGTGYARPLQAGDAFVGFAETQADNTNGAAGDVHVRVRMKGSVELAISGLVITDIGADIYASDDDTFTKTVGSNSFIGRVSRFVSAGVGIVNFDTLVTS
ncbi:MAG: cytoplasmic protein [Rhodospirillales bacterium]|nr:cytoplasmic protein [Rhodospirillales bacterium]